MRKGFIIILSIFCIVVILAKVNIFSNKKKINLVDNHVMTKELLNTVYNYCYEDSNGVQIRIYSDMKEKSPIKTLALYNLCEKGKVDINKMEEKKNKYRFQIEKSLYTNKNYLDLNMIDKNSVLGDYFMAFYVAEKLKDEKLKKKIEEKYIQCEKKELTEVDKIYRDVIEGYLGRGTTFSSKETIYEYIESLGKAEYLEIDYESLDKLRACIAYIVLTKDMICKDWMESIYTKCTVTENEQNIIFYSDVAFEDYVWIIKMLRKYISQENDMDFYNKIAECDTCLYKSCNYEIMSIRNFAAYITALAYSNKDISDNLYNNLVIMYKQIANDVDTKNKNEVYYLRYTAKLLNLNYNLPALRNEEIGNDYYSLLLYKKSVKVRDYDVDIDNGIVGLLTCADVCSDVNKIESKLNQINILEYQSMDEFAVILNLYVSVMKKQGLLTDEVKSQIVEFIQNQKCLYGYAVEGAYDFRTSIYYTNTLYLLEGGKDIGFR